MTYARVTIDDATSLIIDHRGKTPKKLGAEWTTAGHRVISALNIKGSRIDENDHHYVDSRTYANWMKVPLAAGDTLLTSEAPLGEVAYLQHDVDWVLGQRLYALRTKPSLAVGRFLFYALQSPLVRNDLEARATGTTVFGISQVELRKVQIPCPPIAEQRRIAEMLGALDDKIESNRQICSLINLLSEELFCSRFRLRKDCTTKGILTIGDLGEIVGGGTPSKKVEEYYVDSGIAWLTPKDLARDSSTFRHHGAIDISELGLRKSSARSLPRGTVLFTSRAPIGYIAIASGETSTNQGFKSIVPHPEFGTAFTFYLLKQLTPEIVSSANGSTFKEISKGGLASISFDAPDRASVREFNSLVQPLLDLQEAKESETCRLSKLRDALLPELMSGRMRVDEAGRLVTEALDEEVADV